MRWSRSLGALLLAALAACSNDGGAEDHFAGRGSAVCNEWQAAICAWGSACGAVDAAQCERQAEALYCRSDEEARNCADALRAADCSVAPVGCNLQDLADPAPAVQACTDFVSRICEHDVSCGGAGDLDQCRAESGIDCSTVIGVTERFEACMAALNDLSCQANMLPPSCDGALLANP